MELRTTGLQVRFGEVVALAGFDLQLPAGTHMAVWGSAGSGKTTLLKVLAGLVRPTAGSVFWGGRALASLSTDERRKAQTEIGMVFQSDALFDSMTVLENVMLPLEKRGVAEAEATARAEAALDRVGLSDARHKYPQMLSGGMKKRAGVARAIVANPAVLLADDPFAGLDPGTERSVADVLRDVAKNTTLIAALPDPSEALPLARSIHLVEGRLE